jgi:hypothetical protein
LLLHTLGIAQGPATREIIPCPLTADRFECQLFQHAMVTLFRSNE